MVAAHARTPTHKHTHTTINDYSSGIQGWIVGANVGHWGWSLNDPSVHPFSPGQDCCTQPSDHMCTTVYRYRRYFYPLQPAWIKSKLTPSPGWAPGCAPPPTKIDRRAVVDTI